MKKLTATQRKSLAEFFTNSAVAWLTAGIVAPFFLKQDLTNFLSSGFWGILFTIFSLVVSQIILKEVRA